MARGIKLDLAIGASFEDGWELVKPKEQSLAPHKHALSIKSEKRRGKIVTVAKGFCLDKQASKKLLQTIKRTLACGGGLKDGQMELQGELTKPLEDLLRQKGFGFRK